MYFSVISIIVLCSIVYMLTEKKFIRVISITATIIALLLLFNMLWHYSNTADNRHALMDLYYL